MYIHIFACIISFNPPFFAIVFNYLEILSTGQ